MTFFTIDTDPEQSFLKNDRVSQVCLKQIQELVKGTDIEFKIFTPKDKIVQDCMEEFSNYFSLVKKEFPNRPNESAPMEADLIRIYILSKNKNYLYFDSDVYFKNLNILKYLKEEPVALFPLCFGGLWSGEHPELFNTIKDYYKEINDNGYQYIIEKYGKLRGIDYTSDAAAYINSNCNLKPLTWEQIADSSFYHFPSFKFTKDCKYYVCSDKAEEAIKSRPQIWSTLKDQKIKVVCKSFPWFEWEEDKEKNDFINHNVILYGCFTREEFHKLFKELYPDYELIF